MQLDFAPRRQNSLYVRCRLIIITPIVITGIYPFFTISRCSLFLSLSHSLSYFVSPLPSSRSHPSLSCLVVSTWWIASKWRMLWVPYFERFYLERGANWRCFSPRCICSAVSFLYPSFSPSPTICVTILTFFCPPPTPSPLPGSAGGECHSVGRRHGPDLLPPAQLRRINRGHPKPSPADSLLQRHKRCVAMHASCSLSGETPLCWH